MMTKERLVLYAELEQEIHEHAAPLLERYRELRTEVFGTCVGHAAHYVSFNHIEDGQLVYEGDDYWSYGGHEHYRLEFPLRALADPDYETSLRAELRTELEEDKSRACRQAKARELRERGVLQQLLKKYATDTPAAPSDSEVQ